MTNIAAKVKEKVLGRLKTWPLTRPFYFYPQNLLFIRDEREALRRSFSNEDCLLIHQMGKVGSSTVIASLQEIDLGYPVVRTHYLNPETVSRMWKQKVRLHAKLIRRHYLANRFFSEIVAGAEGKDRGWRVISLVREPVVTNISRMFESIEDFIPNYYRRRHKDNLSMRDVVRTFFEDFPYHDWNLKWFDLEMKPVFGIDVFTETFDREKGYHIYRSDRVELLLLKLEALDHCAAAAFDDFLGIEDFAMKKANVGKKKRYSDDYKRFKETAVFPAGYLKQLYEHKYTRHFYTDEEIERFVRKWSQVESKRKRQVV